LSISSFAAHKKSGTSDQRLRRVVFAAAGMTAITAAALLYTSAGGDAGLVKAAAGGGNSLTLSGPAPLIVKTFKVSEAAFANRAEASSPLAEDDPRWGPVKAAASISIPGKSAADPVRFAALSPGAAAGTNEGPHLVTGSISADPGSPEPGAQRQHMVVDIEAIAAAAKGLSMPNSALEKRSTAKIKSDVRLRARGSNSAKVVGVIPGGERVGVVGCRAWCEVTYKGKRGWVYSGFVKGHEGKRVRRKVPSGAPAANETQSASAKTSEEAVSGGSWVRRLFGGGGASEKTKATDEKTRP
jgi:uncharacterized protein YraI